MFRFFVLTIQLFFSFCFPLLFLRGEEQAIHLEGQYLSYPYGISAGPEWICEKPVYAGCASRFASCGISGKMKDYPIRFEFMHCTVKWNSLGKALSAYEYLHKFIIEYNKSFILDNLDFRPTLDNYFRNDVAGDNFITSRVYGYGKWSGICEINIFWDDKDTYVMISSVDLRLTRDRETQDALFEQMRSMMLPLNN